MTVWVIGHRGTLGACLMARLAELGHACVGTDAAELDITDAQATTGFAQDGGFTHLLNAAAYTGVDRAEDEPEQAMAVNRDGPAHLARAAQATGALLVHVSTDYVFDGRQRTPYPEDATCAPLGVYGASKLAGEVAVRGTLGEAAYVVRTSWLFGPKGHDFVGTMARLVRERPEVRVVVDQHGRPTYAPDLAAAILRLSGLDSAPPAPGGTYHFANAGPTTWHALTEAIAHELGAGCAVTPITTADWPTKAARPAYSVLATDKIERAGVICRPWTHALNACLNP